MALPDLVALTLLPWAWWRHIAERLRAGCSAADLLDTLLAERPQRDDTAASLRSRAADALAAAARLGLIPIAWSDPEYPAPLAAVADPPAVLWLAGSREALRPPAVAIVGSRAGSPYALAVAEHLASRFGLSIPPWTDGAERFLDKPFFAGGLESLKAILLVESPSAFRRRQIFVSANALSRASEHATR